MKKSLHTSTYVLYGLLIVTAIAYCMVMFITPVKPASRFNLSDAQIAILRATIIVPLVGVWWAGIFGATRFKDYARIIQKSPDGRALNRIANGLIVLAVGQMMQSMWSSIAAYAWPNHLAGRTIANGYIQLIFPLAAFFIMVIGATDLVRLLKAQSIFKRNILLSAVWFSLFIAVYIGLMLSNPNRNFSSNPRIASYWMSDTLLITTIIIPYVLVWSMGILSAIGIKTYLGSAKGALYRQALSKLSNGILAVILFSISLQTFSAVGGALVSLGLNSILVVLYAIIIFYAVGYFMIASGARRLKKIEEVL